ncbi:non-ribosomal peptide synthetase [Anthocerotibacter panamensis]|uniref:non-ribosomal peptide synthetase n=1 Tax=Anthocerotibacter panamensis TaxID=2857077 RepID=UPI001C401EB1|nr:non-ribosomal peptide synthetase [Anthocerotibacter panamensis]
MSDLARHLAGRSPEEQRALLAQHLQRRSLKPKTFLSSFSQQRLWFLDQLGLNPALYNLPLALHLAGPLDPSALQRALNEIICRHEVLRTTFSESEGRVQQVVAPVLSLEITQIDVPPAWEVLATAEALTPFDLGRGPLLRAKLVHLAAEEHLLLLTMHHIISDGWSIGVLLQELSALYSASAQGQPSGLAPLPIQYADFAHWQHDWLQGATLQRELDYWRGQLAGAPTVLDLPTDFVRPPVQSYRGATFDFTLPTPLSHALKTLSQHEGATLFMTLLAVFKVLLYRYTSQEDLVVGSPIANRNRAELEPLIGFFVNTLVLRTNLSGEPTFREMLRRVRTMTLDAYDHQDLPFEKLVEHLQPERAMSYAPLFQVMFVLQNAPTPPSMMGGLALTPVEIPGSVAKFDLTLGMADTDQGIVAAFEYNTDLFAPETIARMAGHLLMLATAVSTDPDQAIHALPLLTPAERTQLLAPTPAQPDFPPERWMHQRFAAQAQQTPEAVALVYAETQLTYRQLNQQADALAHHLQTLGVGPEVTVGLCMERSFALVVGILGILKAGGAYVPLDPKYPQERLSFILEDAGVNILVTQRGLTLPPTRAQRVYLEGLPPRPTSLDQVEEGWKDQSTADSLAYLIYTSGSTGTPKGVMVSHGNLARLFTATDPWFQFGPADRWALFHSYAFDFSVWELWGALAYGGRLVIVPYEVSRSPEVFYDLLVREQVTVLNQTPSAFRQLMQAEVTASADLALRWVIFGGEALDLASLKPWYERHREDQPRLVNMYGITETTVHVTYRPLTQADAQTATGSFIGQPLPDLGVYLLDAHGQPVPVGVPGELYVGGAGVARGYWKRPELTQERFIAHPFQPGTRLYRSGDLARYRTDGGLEYLGRIDQQVKIRGFRIELGEIQTVLTEHPSVRETVVLAREEQPTDVRLVAYVVLHEPATGAELRQFLQARLPEFMVPAHFVPLSALPLTANGKVDRKALPAPDRSDTPTNFVPPQTPVEIVLAEVWGELLRHSEVGVQDDFFALGGHSLLATQVISRLREVLGIEIPLRYLFEAPTIARLSTLLLQDPQRRRRMEKRAQLLVDLADLPSPEVQTLLDKTTALEGGTRP